MVSRTFKINNDSGVIAGIYDPNDF
jgi:hypothetical protein